jgi:hypothetical protein
MIVYDSHKWFTFWSIRGSIFPKALAYALPSAISAFLLKHFDVLGGKDLLTTGNGTIYSGFTFVLGFILVFRTSQSYNRYWLAATAVHTMRAEWFDACGSLIAFVQITKKGQEHIKEFTHTMIRLFGLMHAMALEEIASMENENFPLLDIAGLRKKDLRVLTHEAAQGRKVEIVAQWIKTSIVNAHENGVLPIPAPILTRVFQELGTGLVHYHLSFTSSDMAISFSLCADECGAHHSVYGRDAISHLLVDNTSMVHMFGDTRICSVHERHRRNRN